MNHNQPSHPTPEEIRRGHETRDVRFLPLVLSMTGLGASLALVFVIVNGVMALLAAGKRPKTEAPFVPGPARQAERESRFPAPQLQVNPRIDLLKLRAVEDAQLTNYAWIDREAGIVRIPIGRAMDLLVQRGLPVHGTNRPPKIGKSVLELQQERPKQ